MKVARDKLLPALADGGKFRYIRRMRLIEQFMLFLLMGCYLHSYASAEETDYEFRLSILENNTDPARARDYFAEVLVAAAKPDAKAVNKEFSPKNLKTKPLYQSTNTPGGASLIEQLFKAPGNPLIEGGMSPELVFELQNTFFACFDFDPNLAGVSAEDIGLLTEYLYANPPEPQFEIIKKILNKNLIKPSTPTVTIISYLRGKIFLSPKKIGELFNAILDQDFFGVFVPLQTFIETYQRGEAVIPFRQFWKDLLENSKRPLTVIELENFFDALFLPPPPGGGAIKDLLINQLLVIIKKNVSSSDFTTAMINFLMENEIPEDIFSFLLQLDFSHPRDISLLHKITKEYRPQRRMFLYRLLGVPSDKLPQDIKQERAKLINLAASLYKNKGEWKPLRDQIFGMETRRAVEQIPRNSARPTENTALFENLIRAYLEEKPEINKVWFPNQFPQISQWSAELVNLVMQLMDAPFSISKDLMVEKIFAALPPGPLGNDYPDFSQKLKIWVAAYPPYDLMKKILPLLAPSEWSVDEQKSLVANGPDPKLRQMLSRHFSIDNPNYPLLVNKESLLESVRKRHKELGLGIGLIEDWIVILKKYNIDPSTYFPDDAIPKLAIEAYENSRKKRGLPDGMGGSTCSGILITLLIPLGIDKTSNGSTVPKEIP